MSTRHTRRTSRGVCLCGLLFVAHRKDKKPAPEHLVLAPALFYLHQSRPIPASRLRQVITERRKHHPVESVRIAANARPHVAVDIGILPSPLDASAIHFLFR